MKNVESNITVKTCCPLCASVKVNDFHSDHTRDYHQCSHCDLVFVPAHQHLSKKDEKAQYDFHDNDPADQGYRQFLIRVLDPIIKRVGERKRGLDFGSGPGPTLSLMFEEAGHKVDLFDIYYANHPEVFEKSYDFITATEVVEHLSAPQEELARLWDCLQPGGVLGIMTKRVTIQQEFETWHYKNDPTHICFFSNRTFAWLGELWGCAPDFVDNDVIIFKKFI